MDLKNIKSWHIALIGMPLVMIKGFLHIIEANVCVGGCDGAPLVLSFGIIIIIYAILDIIPVLFLKNNKTGKIGAISSIILGVLPIFTVSILNGQDYDSVISSTYPSIISLTAAGIYYFWKKI